MAALLDVPATDVTTVRENGADWDERRTENWTGETADERISRFPTGVPGRRTRTGAEVAQIERGYQYDTERNVGEFGRTGTVVQTAEATPANGDSIRIRSEAARDLHNRLGELIPLAGQIPFATQLQLLKRDLSRCHDLLAGFPSETNFLSIVTLVESAVSQQKWKEFTDEQLRLIREAADIGYRQPQVTFEDYESIRHQFSNADIDTHARIDLDAFDFDELTDDEEE